MEYLREIKSRLEKCIYNELEKGIENVNAEDMYKACDMLKDTAETMYYCSIVNAMDEDKEVKLNPEVYRALGSKMYYTETEHNEHDGKSWEIRRRYIENKNSPDTTAKMQTLEDYSRMLHQDVMEMMDGASDNEKQMFRNKLQVLMTKI